MHPSRLELVQTFSPGLDIPIIRIVYDDLTTLDREEIPYLIFELIFDSTP